MRTRTSFLLISLFAFYTTQVFADGFLHTSGQDIVNADNHKILLRGVGLGNWLLPEGYMWRFGDRADRPRRIEKLVSDLAGDEYADKFWREYRANYITEKDIAKIHSLSFNCVRAVLNARLFLTETDPPQYRDEGFQLLDHVITWCRANHVYVIIDMHAAPGGQTGQNIDDSTDDQPLLFMDDKYEKRLTDLWLKIVTKYKDDPTVAMYDLLNEPLPERTGAAAKYQDKLEPMYKRLTTAIRAVDTRHMITVEGYNWANNWSCFIAPPFDSNLVYQFHYYCWDTPTKLKSIDNYLQHRDRLNAPIWVGETGEKDNTIYYATTDYFESQNIGWCFWPWKKLAARNGPYSVTPPDAWAEISAYSRSNTNAPVPSRKSAQKIFDQLLQNIRLENCTYNEEVVNALFRRPPLTVEAENFGHAGADTSYSISPTTQKSPRYRISEPVQIEGIDPTGHAIHLTAGEWTAYEVQSPADHDYTVTLRIKADQTPAQITMTINGTPHDANVTTSGWTDVPLGQVQFHSGRNTLKLSPAGPVLIDSISIR